MSIGSMASSASNDTVEVDLNDLRMRDRAPLCADYVVLD